MTDQPARPANPYILLFRNTGPENYRHLSADARQELVVAWNAWFEDVVTRGKAVIGQPLEPETRIVRGPGGTRITDGPFPEAKEAVGGFVTLLVQDLDEATAIAQRHPGLAHGLVIEVRAMTPHCHLGVHTRPAAQATARG
ncbi:MAG TPA: YciI family protein [Planctomycetota bacterium]|nr:YciI family protein [Planctomycetota bacterium]